MSVFFVFLATHVKDPLTLRNREKLRKLPPVGRRVAMAKSTDIPHYFETGGKPLNTEHSRHSQGLGSADLASAAESCP